MTFGLDSISFATFDWPLSMNEPFVRTWRTEDVMLGENFCDFPAGLESLDPRELEEALLSMMPEGTRLIELRVAEIDSVPAIVGIMQGFEGDDSLVFAAVLIPFAECFWILRLEVNPGVQFTDREIAAFAAALASADRLDELALIPGVSDRRWDGIAPIEKDPLARVRLLVAALVSSIRLKPEVLTLEPFSSDG